MTEVGERAASKGKRHKATINSNAIHVTVTVTSLT